MRRRPEDDDSSQLASKGGNGWLATCALIVSAMAGYSLSLPPQLSLIVTGAGVLVIPHAVMQSGWIGLLLIAVSGVTSCVTSQLLGEVMHTSHGLREYVDHFFYSMCSSTAMQI